MRPRGGKSCCVGPTRPPPRVLRHFPAFSAALSSLLPSRRGEWGGRERKIWAGGWVGAGNQPHSPRRAYAQNPQQAAPPPKPTPHPPPLRLQLRCAGFGSGRGGPRGGKSCCVGPTRPPPQASCPFPAFSAALLPETRTQNSEIRQHPAPKTPPSSPQKNYVL